MKGFTLVEVLVSIAIIGILMTISVLATTRVRVKSRDIKRVSNVTEIVSALEAYYAANHAYPLMITAGMPIASNGKEFLKAVPYNPFPRTDGGCANQDYIYTTTTTGYKLTGCLGSDNGRFSQGTVVCKNGNCGVPDDALCGTGVTVTDRDGNIYPTVQIGTQCWMAMNLKTKTKPDGTCINSGASYVAPSCTKTVTGVNCQGVATAGTFVCGGENGSKRDCVTRNGSWVSERGLDTDCYTNIYIPDAGAIYTWTAAMNGSTVEGAQGICPNGWHIPKDSEWYTLESYLTTPPVNSTTCNPSRLSFVTAGCLSAGSKLIDPSSSGSGFKAALVGGRTSYSMFAHFGLGTDYWSSTWSRYALGTYGMMHNFYIVRIVSNGDAGVFRADREDIDAFPVRCIKD